ncbi:MAG: carboxymuconolactone decarboxylase family protein [Candidatus Kariarchaeaceae archaeon]|jgi:4-carboxymuconolactone decarboxylase
MTKLIPDRDKRIADANNIGKKLYKDNWESLLTNLESLDPNFTEFVREIPYGSVYPREALSLQRREIAAITALTQLNLKPQLKSHIIGALNVGVSKEEILELFLHIAMYIGFPLVLDGLKVAKEVFSHYKL